MGSGSVNSQSTARSHASSASSFPASKVGTGSVTVDIVWNVLAHLPRVSTRDDIGVMSKAHRIQMAVSSTRKFQFACDDRVISVEVK